MYYHKYKITTLFVPWTSSTKRVKSENMSERVLAKWITHDTPSSCLLCKASMKQDKSQVNSSMCDPFCKHPAFLAKAILTLFPGYPL